jgi:LysM repeat protein
MEENRNPRPQEPSSNLPIVTLGLLTLVVLALLYVGWQSLSDEKNPSNDLTTVRPDSVSITRVGSEVPIVNDNEATDDTKKKNVTDLKPEDSKKKKEEPKEVSTKETVVEGEEISHTVQEGETFFGIANRYNLSKDALVKMNKDIDPNGIKVGVTKLKVKIQTIHTVGAGDVLRVVAKKYGVTKQLLMQANKKTKDFTERGEKLIIPLK